MKCTGYMGKILYVDLTGMNIREKNLDMDLAKNYIGDWGIDAKLAFDLIEPGIDPLSPENVIIIGAGPLVGTPTPFASRCTLFTKYPATNTIGPAGGGMGFGCRLKYAGYDELIITGRADKPVYLKISDNDVQICDAADLWGLDIFHSTDQIWKRHGTDCSVLCIGQAGENLVKISLALIDKSDTIGRFGLGAVMGSKNLKLIVAGGRKGVSISDWARFKQLTDEIMADVINWPSRYEYLNLGPTQFGYDKVLNLLGVTNYYSDVVNAGTRESMGPQAYLKRAKKARFACPSCPMACRDIEEVREGEHQGLITFQHSSVTSHGLHLQLRSMEEFLKFTDELQRYGVDRFEACSGAEFLLDLHKREIISKSDLEGIEMGHGKTFIKLVEKIAFRQGIGDVLADGFQGIVREFGKECGYYGNYVKGADLFFDARLSKLGTWQLELLVSPVGPNSGKGGQVASPTLNPLASPDPELVQRFAESAAITPKHLRRILDTPFKVNIGRLLRHTEDYYTAFCCLGVCIESAHFYTMAKLAEFFSAVTGIETEAYELKRAAERAWNTLKALNIREGQSREDDNIPQKWLQPLKAGDKKIRLTDYYETKILTKEDIEKMIDDYYDERGWDIETGSPTKAKLTELGLGHLVAELGKAGIALK